MAVVTISRQVGSFGDEIAALAAEKLGYELISRERIHELAQECDADFQKACSLYEEEIKPLSFFDRLFFGDPAYTALFESLNYELASQGDVVILGRGAQIALGHVSGVFNCRIVAPKELRVERIQTKKGLRPDEARDFVETYGARRRALIESIYHHRLSDWSLYDLVLNTAAISPQDGADILCVAVSKKAVAQPEDLSVVFSKLAFAKKVESAIKKKITTSTFRDVKVTAESGGVVTLNGYVSDKRGKDRAEQIARGVDGVKEVINQLGTTELSF